MAVPTWVGSGAGDATATLTTRSPTNPAHQAGDIIMVAALYNGDATFSISSGWNLAGSLNASSLSTSYWWRRATDSSTPTPTVTSSVAATSSQVLYCISWVIRGAISSGEIFDNSYMNGPSSVSPPNLGHSFETLDADVLGVLLVFGDTSNSITSGPSGWTNRINTSTTTGGGARVMVYTRDFATATSISNPTTGSYTGTWHVIAWGIRSVITPGTEDLAASHTISMVHNAGLGGVESGLAAAHSMSMTHTSELQLQPVVSIASAHTISMNMAGETVESASNYSGATATVPVVNGSVRGRAGFSRAR